MREIKFRGRRQLGEWIYGSLLISKFKDNKVDKYYITQFAGNYTFDHEVDPATVGQFTDLQDKNGKDIYEWDIVISFKKPYEDSPTTNVVEFAKGCWRLVCKGVNDVPLFNYSPKELQVIGNQYESPELINNK